MLLSQHWLAESRDQKTKKKGSRKTAGRTNRIAEKVTTTRTLSSVHLLYHLVSGFCNLRTKVYGVLWGAGAGGGGGGGGRGGGLGLTLAMAWTAATLMPQG